MYIYRYTPSCGKATQYDLPPEEGNDANFDIVSIWLSESTLYTVSAVWKEICIYKSAHGHK